MGSFSIAAPRPRSGALPRRADRAFYSAMAAAVVVVGLGSSHSYDLRSYFGRPALTPLRAVRGAVFTAWILLYLTQSPEAHRRLMLLATISILEAAVGRLPPTAAFGTIFIFGVVDVLALTGIAYDLLTRRRVHRVYLWGAPLVIGGQPVRLAISRTGPWLAFARVLTRR